MTLDEAIIHASDVADSTDCEECRANHLQLAEWLAELKRVRAERDAAVEDLHQNLVSCSYCKHYGDSRYPWDCEKYESCEFSLKGKGNLDLWEWRGVQNND